MTNLILHVTPELQVSEGALKVAFFDKEIVKIKPNEDPDAPKEIVSKETKLCLRIENKEDGYSIIERPANKIRLTNQFGDRYYKEEKDIYKNAYAKYLEIKSKPVFNAESELEIARKRIAELEAKPSVFVADLENDSRTASELKIELDKLGVEYKGNASKETLLSLLNK